MIFLVNRDLLKSRNFLIGAVAIVILLLVGSFFLFRGSGNAPVAQETLEEEPVPTISPDELGLSLKMGPAGQTVILTVENTQGIEAIEYELSYLAGDIPRGAIGKINLNRKPAREEITLGTCSDVCHYDEDVSDIKIVLKITKDDGKIYQSEATLDNSE